MSLKFINGFYEFSKFGRKIYKALARKKGLLNLYYSFAHKLFSIK